MKQCGLVGTRTRVTSIIPLDFNAKIRMTPRLARWARRMYVEDAQDLRQLFRLSGRL